MDIVYGKDRADLEQLLLAIDRPGDFCVHGRSLYLMPRIVVDGVGTLSFPVPDAQARALVAAAERAPYGKGPDTRVDTTVRDCWQIDAARVKIAGGAWPKTFARILAAAGAGLGCPLERLDARLYKLLVYEPGGFFAAHRDTEKTDGMVATLSIALPATGGGGELIVRHRDREMVLDMHADEPSELAFAAFYADCVHETRPVRDGHRLSLVFNLCLRAGDTQTPLRPPDHAERITAITERLAGLRADAAEDKLVWLLEHEYTAAGLTFDALLARSSTPPAEPRDWSIAADVACDCDLCRKLSIFCQDPVVREARFPVRQDLRDHLRLAIERQELDLDHETERRGRPYSLVCTKNRASHKRRNTEYVGDVSRMRWLLESAPRRDETERFPAEQERLRQAIAAAERIR